jgi:hypothetical protein
VRRTEKVQRTSKVANDRKSKKLLVRIKRRKLGIYENEQSVLESIQRINNNQRIFSEMILGIYDALYIKWKRRLNKTCCASANP